jgi:hypothetical protein
MKRIVLVEAPLRRYSCEAWDDGTWDLRVCDAGELPDEPRLLKDKMLLRPLVEAEDTDLAMSWSGGPKRNSGSPRIWWRLGHRGRT